MNSQQNNLDFINIIKGLAYSQMVLQDERATLINSGYFSDSDAFNQIDTKNSGKVQSTDLVQYLGVHRIAASERQCQYIIWNTGSPQPFLTYEYFRQYMSNGQPQLFDKMQSSTLSRNRNQGDQIMISYGQRQMAKIFQKEIQYYRAIQLLRQDFIKKYGYQFKNVISIIYRQKKGNIGFNALINFVHENGVQFSIQQFQGLSRKINAKHHDFISIKQMLRALSPFEPLSFPTYRKQSNIQKAMDYINQEVDKLHIDVNYLPFEEPERAKKTSTGFQKVVDNFRTTSNKGATGVTNKYFYDKNYYNQLRQYKTSYFDPNKQNKKKYQECNDLIGPQYHDHFFTDYYLYLDERNKSEHYYNKFGKRYTFDNPIAKTMDQKFFKH